MLEYREVTKRFDGAAKRPRRAVADTPAAVDGFSITIPSHRFTVFVGSSGCGKTTLLRMVNRMVEPTSGQVLIDGVDVAALDVVRLRRSIGYVLQDGGLLPHRTVLDNVASVPRLSGVGKADARDMARRTLGTVGLDASLAERYPAQLSGGQRQRVGVARALASDPNILLMDEPFGAVDPLVRADLQREMLRLHETLGTTVVFVTHDIDEAFLLGQWIVVLQPGAHIAQQGPPSEILGHPANEFVAEFVGPAERTRILRA